MPRTMFNLLTVSLLAIVGGCARSNTPLPMETDTMSPSQPSTTSVYDFSAESIDGKPVDLAAYRGRVLLIVNVASRCGNTPQYADLEKLYKQYAPEGLVILGFPANDFGHQEPGTNMEIQTFCRTEYGVTFPMFAKIHVKGPDKAPLYAWLTDPTIHPATGGEIGWNFAKFLIGRDGQVVARFKPKTKPMDPKVVGAIRAALAVKTD